MSLRKLAIAGLVLSATGCSMVLGLDIAVDGGGGAGAGGSETGGAPTDGGGGAGGDGPGGGGGGQGGDASGGGGTGGAPADLQCLDDEFATMPSSCWSGELNKDLVDLSVDEAAPGELVISITEGTPSWVHSQQSYLLFKEVIGPFAVVANVRATNNAGNGIPTGGDYQLAGLLVQDWDNDDTWEKLEVGVISEGNVGILSGHTIGGVTSLDGAAGHQDVGNQAILGICRDGADEWMMFRLPGDNTFSQHVHDQEVGNLSDPLRVGVFANAYMAPVDISGRFDYFRLRNDAGLSFSGVSDCIAVLDALVDDGPLECSCP